MRLIIILATLTWAVPAVAAPPPKAPPVSINIRTAGDLAVACSAKPVSPRNAALLNFCNGLPKGCADRTAEPWGIEDLPAQSCAQTQRDHEAIRHLGNGRYRPQGRGCERELHPVHVGTLSLQQGVALTLAMDSVPQRKVACTERHHLAAF